MTSRLGRYETLRAIASGGMATVHLARALGAGGFERFVAIKVMHPHIATDPEFVAMFLDEARLAARVRHPNVVATIDVQEDPLFLVMEYIEGPSLHLVTRELRKQKQLAPLDVALRIFLDILSGLHAAHELLGPDGELLNLIHRDVSPQNMLLGVDGISRITDFGVARAESRLSTTRGGQMKGKLSYMAPEQIASQPIDRRCDIYAAGVVLWELLANQKLFRGDNDAAIMANILAGADASPHDCVPSVPYEISAVCMQALHVVQEQRFATAADFADALEDAARRSGVIIASSRAVSAFVKQIALHEAPASPSARGMTPPNGPISSASFTPRPMQPPVSATPSPFEFAVTGETMSAVLPNAGIGQSLLVPSPPPKSKKRFAAAAAAAVVIVGVAIIALRVGSSPEAGTPAASGVPVAAASPPPPEPVQSAVPSAEPSASSEAPEPSSHASAPSARPAVRVPGRPHAAPPRGPAPRAKPDQPQRPSATSFSPVDL